MLRLRRLVIEDTSLPAPYHSAHEKLEAAFPGHAVAFGLLTNQRESKWERWGAAPLDRATPFPPEPGTPFWAFDPYNKRELLCAVHSIITTLNPDLSGPYLLTVILLARVL